jgi:hypothetical protein
VTSQRVDVALTWPTARPSRQQPASVKVLQREFAHEMLVLTYYVEPHAVQRYKEGTPLAVQWGVKPNALDTFYGTVLYVRPHLENDKHSLHVICIGTSYPFKDSSPAVYADVAVEQIVSREVSTARLSLVRDSSGVTWPLITRHTGETGWEFITRQAQRVGYTWFVNKVTAHFYDPVKTVLSNTQSLPVLTYKFGRGNAFEGDITTFTPELGDQGVPHHETRARMLLSVDPRSRDIIGASSTGSTFTSLADVKTAPKFTDYIDHPAYTVGEALVRALGVEGAQRWRHKARATVHGNARIHQGSGVIIEGVSEESDGIWYVHAVEHEVTREDKPYWRYYSHLDLVRDSRSRAYIPRGPRRSLRSSVVRSGTQVNPRAPRAVWTGSKWVAETPSELVLP